MLGPEHTNTLRSASNLASLLQRQGKFIEAEAMSRRALEGQEKTLRPEHPDTLKSVSNLVLLSQVYRRDKMAEAMSQRAI